MKTKVNSIVIGIVGMGQHIVQSHIPYLLHGGAVISRYFDPGVSQDQADHYSCFEGHIIPVSSSLQEILEDLTIDVIIIGSPDEYHPDQLLAAIEAGKHVFIEKPLAIDSAGMEKVVLALAMAKEKGLVVSSCHPRRYDPPIVELKALLSNRRDLVERYLGKIQEFKFSFIYHKVTDQWKKNRSLMLDHFGHEIDLMRHLFDMKEPKIPITARRIFDGYAQYKVGGMLGDLKFQFEGKRILEESKYMEFLEIHGEKGFLQLSINDGLLFLQTYEGATEEIQLSPKSYELMFAPVNEDFLEAVQTGANPYLLKYDLLINNLSGITIHETGLFSSENYNF